jgi:hypothetical protein
MYGSKSNLMLIEDDTLAPAVAPTVAPGAAPVTPGGSHTRKQRISRKKMID